MSSNRQRQTLADFVAIALSPALIMGLVGSLVFFLVEVILGPNPPGRLLWILFFFVFAAVLISRISMSSDIADRAPLYGLIVGLLVFLGLQTYVKYGDDSPFAGYAFLVNACLIAIIWWSAHRLTRDSTVIDDKEDASGAGLLQVAGLDNSSPLSPQGRGVGGEGQTRRRFTGFPLTPDAAPLTLDPAPRKRGEGRKSALGFVGWLTRYQKYREEVNKRPHAPGIWVVYFSLAALPLFGLGQSLIPPADGVRRRYVFWLMAIYVASGLGLLLTTSFLNLRRYLRQRNLQMPISMTGVWLSGGILVIAVLLSLGAIIPRPNAEYALVDIRGIVSVKEHEKTRSQQGNGHAKGKSDQGKEDGKEDEDKTPSSASLKKGGKKQTTGTGEGKGNTGAGQQKQTGSDGKNSKGELGQGGSQESSAPLLPNAPAGFLGGLFLALKWIVGGIVALVIAFFILRAAFRFLANFTHWASRLLQSCQSFWDSFMSWLQGKSQEATLVEAQLLPPPSFASFRNPFLNGDSDRMSPAALVRYTFDALEAWGSERGVQQQAGETQLEFVERLAADFPAVEKAALELAELYAGLAFARRSPPPERLKALRELWLLLGQLDVSPMSRV
jgi:hypothetical protein